MVLEWLVLPSFRFRECLYWPGIRTLHFGWTVRKYKGVNALCKGIGCVEIGYCSAEVRESEIIR